VAKRRIVETVVLRRKGPSRSDRTITERLRNFESREKETSKKREGKKGRGKLQKIPAEILLRLWDLHPRKNQMSRRAGTLQRGGENKDSISDTMRGRRQGTTKRETGATGGGAGVERKKSERTSPRRRKGQVQEK